MTPIGSSIRRMRKAAELTQQELADASGVSRAYINGLETGGFKNPSINVLKMIAASCKCNVAEFFREEVAQ
jgi:transcriptional regulator with XRE-family HTH domain